MWQNKMAPIKKKTYLRKNNDSFISQEKENVDPFDELLSSPLKQDVEFKPLSFWNKKEKEAKFNKKKIKCGLFEVSDSDTGYSPVNKKKKARYESLGRRTKKLQMRKTNSVEMNNNSIMIDSTFELEKYLNPSFLGNFEKSKLPQINHSHNLQFVTKKRRFSKKMCSDFLSNNEIVHKENKTIFNSDNSFSENPALRIVDESFDLTKSSNETTLGFDSSRDSSHSTVFDSVMLLNESSVCNSFSDINNNNEETLSFKNSLGDKSLQVSENEFTLSDLELDESTIKIIFSKMLEELENSGPDSTGLITSANTTIENGSSGSSCEDSTICQSVLENTVIKGKKNSKPQKHVNALTTLMSDMTLENMTSKDVASDFHKSDFSENGIGQNKGSQKDSNAFSSDIFRNVTTRRRFNSFDQSSPNTPSNLYAFKKPRKVKDDTSPEVSGEKSRMSSQKLFDGSPQIQGGRLSLAWDRLSCLPNPIFESTRVMENDFEDSLKNENSKNMGPNGTANCQDYSVVLKTGKKWMRSLSVLKQVQNGSIVPDYLESTQVKGKKYQDFVQNVLEMQNDLSSFSTILPNATLCKKRLTNEVAKNTSDISCFYETAADFHSALQEDENSAVFSSDDTGLSTVTDKTMMNHTVKVVLPESSLGRPSAFRSALKLDTDKSRIEDSNVKEESSVISPRDFILAQCGQDDVLPFEEYFNEKTLKNCKKIGEGVYGEVFMYNSDTVIKIIPIEGDDKVNEEPQKKFEEILSEVVIAMKLSNLRKGKKNRTNGFSELKRCWCVIGKYPQYLLDLWNDYDQAGSGSENDSPVMFKSDQLYIILELAHGGKDLEAYVFNSAEQSLSIFVQTAFSLAAAEKAFEFEHRDLHWGNLLIAPTNEKFTTVVLDKVEYNIPTKGVQVSIIDFTLSRMSHEGCSIFNDLSVDPTFFTSQGDYQFEVYRMMQQAVKNDWSAFVPKTNLYWLHYTIDKMIKMVRYKNKKAQVHKKYLKKFKTLESVILQHEDSSDFVLNEDLI